MAQCPSCGGNVADDAKFCDNCHAMLEPTIQMSPQKKGRSFGFWIMVYVAIGVIFTAIGAAIWIWILG